MSPVVEGDADEKRDVDVAEAAARLEVHPREIYEAIDHGDRRAQKVIRIDLADLEAWARTTGRVWGEGLSRAT